jgi:hypothetical protein
MPAVFTANATIHLKQGKKSNLALEMSENRKG